MARGGHPRGGHHRGGHSRHRRVRIRYRGVRLRHRGGRPVSLTFKNVTVEAGRHAIGGSYRGLGFSYHPGDGTDLHAAYGPASVSHRHRESTSFRADYGPTGASHTLGSGTGQLTLGPLDADVSRDQDGTVNIDVRVEPLRDWLVNEIQGWALSKVETYVTEQVTQGVQQWMEAVTAAKYAAAAAEAAAAQAAYDAAYAAAHAAALAAGALPEAAVAVAEEAGIAALTALL